MGDAGAKHRCGYGFVHMNRVPVAGELGELVNIGFGYGPATTFEAISDVEVIEIPSHLTPLYWGATQVA